MNNSLLFIAGMLLSSHSLADWNVVTNKDSFNDSPIVTASTQASGASLHVRCANNELDVIVDYGRFLSNKSVDSRWRFDIETTERKTKVSTRGTAIFIGSLDVNNVARELVRSSNSTFGSKDYRGTEHIAKFSLKGSSKAIKPVLSACSIPLKQVTYTDVDSEVSAYIDAKKAPELKCMSVQLTALGYAHTPENQESFYQAANKFIADQLEQCPKEQTAQNFPRWRSCQKKSDLFFYLYADTRDSNEVADKGC